MAYPCPSETIRGFEIYRQFLNCAEQEAIVADLRDVAKKAPFFKPLTPGGRRMSVQMTSAGRCGWVPDQSGYRYQNRHPAGNPWPEIPASLQSVWKSVSGST